MIWCAHKKDTVFYFFQIKLEVSSFNLYILPKPQIHLLTKYLPNNKLATSVLQVVKSWYSLIDGFSANRGDLENISLYDSIVS